MLAAVLGLALGQDGTAAGYQDDLLLSSDGQDGCTIGVASGVVTPDGRPLLWKVRDITEGQARQEVVHVAGLPYGYIGVCTEEEGIYMGLSEAGVASGNSLVKLTSGLALNSSVQATILRSFATVDQVEAYFLSEMQAGTCNASSCFPFIDASGNARIFEVNRSVQIWGYDSMDPDRQAQGLYGLVVRANEFHMRSDGTDNTFIGGRYASGTYNVLGLIAKGALIARALVQGYGDPQDYCEFIRYGPGRSLETISRTSTQSAIVVHGVLPQEDPALATMWVLLGQTNYSIAVPTWARVSQVPDCIAAGLMYDRARSLWAKGKEAVTQASVLPLEAHLFDVVTQTLLPHWRAYGTPTVSEMTRIEDRMAGDAYSLLDCLDRRRGNNQAPTVSLRAWPDGMTWSFSVAGQDPDGVIIGVEWDFGDGGRSAETSALHEYDRPGTYLVSCTVIDDMGVSVTDWRYYQVPVDVDLADDDQMVTLTDLAHLASGWRKGGCAEPDWCGGADLDRIGSVDALDLYVLSSRWLSTTGAE